MAAEPYSNVNNFNNAPIPSETQPAGPTRLSWASLLTVLIAYGTVFRGAPGLLLLPALGLAVCTTYLTNARIVGRGTVYWTTRVALLGLSLFFSTVETRDIIYGTDPRQFNLLALLFASEIAFQCWRPQKATGGFAARIALLAEIVYIRAGNSAETEIVRWTAPFFVLFLTLSLRGYRQRGNRRLGRNVLQTVAPVLLFLLMVVPVFALQTVIQINKAQLMSLSDNLFRAGGMRLGFKSWAHPVLGRMFGDRGSPARVLRLEQYTGPDHLRGVAYSQYQGGEWGPPIITRPLGAASDDDLLPRAASVAPDRDEFRFAPLNGDTLLYLPLETIGVDLAGAERTTWERGEHSPIRVVSTIPYKVLVPTSKPVSAKSRRVAINLPSIFKISPPANRNEIGRAIYMSKYLSRYTDVPRSLDPGVNELAQRIAGRLIKPTDKIEAVTRYLLNHYHYSLTIDPGPGDPVSNFLLHKDAAHCEYFASAAVLLLRCVGVPTRYVTGYYAHESDGKGNTIVRQRDAHAWAEAWVPNRGWVTVDATPGDGRYDQVPITAWDKASEWLADEWERARTWLSTVNTAIPALIIVAVSGTILLFLTIRFLRRRGKRGKWGDGYTLPEGELQPIAERYTKLLGRLNITIPPNQTWWEHLPQAEKELPGAVGQAAQVFVRSYNAARFGLQNGSLGTLLTELSEQLTALENRVRATEQARREK